ncbi:MAG: S-layer homology domain-containing protein [Oscillospiraceae bacterium]|nr:S-layer homology domain-containing protein [Oscillospiraceae bacterium]
MKKSHTTRFLSLLLSLVLSFSLYGPALAADSSFSDIDSSYWAWDAVQNCVDLGIVTGFEDGSFRPDDPVTGVQFVAMITRTFYSADVEAAQDSKPSGSPWYWANLKIGEDKYLTNSMTIEEKAMNRYDMANIAKNVLIGIYQGFLPDSGVH